MKQKIFLFLFLLLCCTLVSARVYKPTADEQIKAQALILKGTSVNTTIENVKFYVWDNFRYEFHWRPQDARDTWRSKKADCTDEAIFMKAMLDYIYTKKKLNLKFMSGYCDGQKHDWLVLNKTVIIDNFYCNDRKTVSFGIW